MALILFMVTLPVFTFVLSPLSSISSRKHEFEADAFAVKHTNAPDLVNALVKLYEDNASTLTPDPLHWRFGTIRIHRLRFGLRICTNKDNLLNFSLTSL